MKFDFGINENIHKKYNLSFVILNYYFFSTPGCVIILEKHQNQNILSKMLKIRSRYKKKIPILEPSTSSTFMDQIPTTFNIIMDQIPTTYNISIDRIPILSTSTNNSNISVSPKDIIYLL